MRERTQLEKTLGEFRTLEQDYRDAVDFIELGEAEGDDSVVREAEETLVRLQKQAATQELQTLLSGEADANDCFIEVHAGAGGTESQDWAQMLLRMYMRWAEAHGYKVELMEESFGEEAGIKSATARIQGHNAYGWLKTESGVHRLVRISPYDSSARRHTSFASVWVYPEIDDDIEVEVEEKDLRIDTYRSQHRNRAEAMRMLRARLYEAELQRREEAAQAEQDAKTDIGWGHQIRSYVLHPYQMVKDLRTETETSDTQGVLDGDLDDFMAAALAQRVTGDKEDAARSGAA